MEDDEKCQNVSRGFWMAITSIHFLILLSEVFEANLHVASLPLTIEYCRWTEINFLSILFQSILKLFKSKILQVLIICNKHDIITYFYCKKSYNKTDKNIFKCSKVIFLYWYMKDSKIICSASSSTKYKNTQVLLCNLATLWNHCCINFN